MPPGFRKYYIDLVFFDHADKISFDTRVSCMDSYSSVLKKDLGHHQYSTDDALYSFERLLDTLY